MRGRPKAPQTPDTRCIARRIDWLEIKFQGTLRPELVSMLRERQSEARRLKTAVPVELSGREFRMAPDRTEGRWGLEGEHCFIRLDEHPKCGGRWCVGVQLHGMYMATHTRQKALALAEQIARGSLVGVQGARVARLDLAADFVGLPVERIGLHAWVLPSHCSLQMMHDSEGERVRTGYCIGTRGEGHFRRVYCKTRELERPSTSEEKRALEQELWLAGGWNRVDVVTRVEDEIRAELLQELGFLEPATCLENLDRIWQYVTHKRRLARVRARTRASRCPTDPRWEVVQGVVFEHANAQPAKRTRKPRGTIGAKRLLGAVLSYAAGAGTLDTSPVLIGPDGKRLSEAEHIERSRWDGPKCEAVLRREIRKVMKLGADVVAAELLGRFDDPRDALAALRERKAALYARTWGLREQPSTEVA